MTRLLSAPCPGVVLVGLPGGAGGKCRAHDRKRHGLPGLAQVLWPACPAHRRRPSDLHLGRILRGRAHAVGRGPILGGPNRLDRRRFPGRTSPRCVVALHQARLRHLQPASHVGGIHQPPARGVGRPSGVAPARGGDAGARPSDHVVGVARRPGPRVCGVARQAWWWTAT